MSRPGATVAAAKDGHRPAVPERKDRALLGALRAEKKLLAVMALVVVVFGVGAHLASDRAGAWRHQAAEDLAQASTDNAAWQAGQAVKAHGRLWQRRLAKAEAALPAGEDQPGFVADMAALASRCGATWSSSSWTPGQGVGGDQAWQVQASVTGTSGSVNCVVSGLAGLPRAVGLTGLSLSYESGDVVQAALSLSTFARPAGQGSTGGQG